jgi:selenocysteine lyase/cysteine desulfurase
MTPDLLERDEELRQREFPVARNKIFLAHAGVCPLPACVARAMQVYLDQAQTGDQEKTFYAARIFETRQLAAQLLGCGADEIALVGPTSVGLSLVANGLPWKSGDEVVCYQDDYPSNVYAWTQLRAHGVKVRYVQPRNLGAIDVSDVEPLLNERTRLVALASVHFLSGVRLDHSAIARLCRDRNILFCVDGIQSIGALETPLEGVDFLAADAHKWMLGPLAAGILFVRKEVQDQLRPTLVGWANAACPGFVASDNLKFHPDASRYEAGSHNLVGLIGLHACLEMLLDAGLPAIQEKLLRQSRFLRAELSSRGWELLGDEKRLSGSVSFFKNGADLEALFEKMIRAGIVPSLREDRAGQRYLRLSPHFYNTRAELEKTLTEIGTPKS